MKSKNQKFSIVFSIYKGKYLIRALRSIQNQYFNDLEIIFVIDNPINKNIKIILEKEK